MSTVPHPHKNQPSVSVPPLAVPPVLPRLPKAVPLAQRVTPPPIPLVVSALPARPIRSVWRENSKVLVIAFSTIGTALVVAIFILLALKRASGPSSVGASSGSGFAGLFSSSPYTVDYEVVERGYHAVMNVAVKGPAAKLAVILTSPDGKTSTRVIGSEQMITNSATECLYMDLPQAGSYTLIVKTFEPEKVVSQKKISFSLNRIWAEDCDASVEQLHGWGSQKVTGVKIIGAYVDVKKEGNLPLVFSAASVSVGGKDCMMSSIVKGGVMLESKQRVWLRLECQPTQRMMDDYNSRPRGIALPPTVAVFKPGDRYVMEGKLFYNGREKSISFRKELVFTEDLFGEKKGGRD